MFRFAFSKCRSLIVAATVTAAAIGGATKASAEAPDGWKATGPESQVFSSQRDDGRWVGVYARPATKGSDSGMLVRVSLSGFKDKQLALRQGDLPELFHNYGQYDGKGWWPKIRDAILRRLKDMVKDFIRRIEKLVARELKKAAITVLGAAGGFETMAATGFADSLEGAGAMAIETRSDAIIAATRAGGDLTQRFVRANGQTIQNVPAASRGKVVRAIHSALMTSGAK